MTCVKVTLYQNVSHETDSVGHMGISCVGDSLCYGSPMPETYPYPPPHTHAHIHTGVELLGEF